MSTNTENKNKIFNFKNFQIQFIYLKSETHEQNFAFISCIKHSNSRNPYHPRIILTPSYYKLEMRFVYHSPSDSSVSRVSSMLFRSPAWCAAALILAGVPGTLGVVLPADNTDPCWQHLRGVPDAEVVAVWWHSAEKRFAKRLVIIRVGLWESGGFWGVELGQVWGVFVLFSIFRNWRNGINITSLKLLP